MIHDDRHWRLAAHAGIFRSLIQKLGHGLRNCAANKLFNRPFMVSQASVLGWRLAMCRMDAAEIEVRHGQCLCIVLDTTEGFGLWLRRVSA